jgi:thymidine phosphorylase
MNIINKGLEIAELLNDNPALAREVGNYIETKTALRLIEQTTIRCDFDDQVNAVARGLAQAAGDMGGYDKYLDQAFYLLDS